MCVTIWHRRELHAPPRKIHSSSKSRPRTAGQQLTTPGHRVQISSLLSVTINSLLSSCYLMCITDACILNVERQQSILMDAINMISAYS